MKKSTLTLLRNLVSEIRSSHVSAQPNLVRYVMAQARRYQVTDEQLCKARDEMEFLGSTYLCYLRSVKKLKEIHQKYRGKGERSVRETAQMLGFKLPHDLK